MAFARAGRSEADRAAARCRTRRPPGPPNAADGRPVGAWGNQAALRMLGYRLPNGELHRKCSCAGSGGAGGECPQCAGQREALLDRKAAGVGASSGVPPIVNDVLRSCGQELDPGVRGFMEPRLGMDLRAVRVHTGEQAAESAAAVNALAYTVGRRIVFGAGQYSPDSGAGRALIAHELAHVVQQGAAESAGPQRISNPDDASERQADAAAEAVMRSALPPGPSSRLDPELPAGALLARACMSKEDCAKKKERTPEELMKEETAKPENKDKRDKRKAACTKTPPDPGCTADGHGARAVQAEKVLHDWDPERLKFIKKIVVDKDMESGFGALTGPCSDFMPPIAGGGLCTFIPDRLESEAAQFNNTMDPKIGGLSRDLWRDKALMTLMHETEHARFDVTRIASPRAGACKFDDIEDALSEIAAMLVEFPIVFRASRENVSLTEKQRADILDRWFKGRITNEFQSFKSTLHSIYCICECPDADAYVKKTIEFSTADWSAEEKARLHTEMNDPKWAEHKLRWPVKPPPPAAGASPKP